MANGRGIVDALRVAAVWLLVVSVFFGPAGLGGSFAFAVASKPCGVLCPCDAAAHGGHAAEHDELADDPCAHHHDADSEHEDSAPCEDECPDGCPDCRCCLDVAMAVIQLELPTNPPSSASARTLAPTDASPSGAGTDVFRRPRSLART
jgi:hypothetical protein